jgi:hypothetical protein
MKLRIHYSPGGASASKRNHQIDNFTDLDLLAREVAADVKRWARQIPLRTQPSTFNIKLTAEWGEPVEKKKRK